MTRIASPVRPTRSGTPTRRSQATPGKTPSKRVSKGEEESISPLVSPSKRPRTPRTTGARRLEKLELEAKEAANATATEESADEVKLGRVVKLFQDEDDAPTAVTTTTTRTEVDKAPKTPQKDKRVGVSGLTPSSAIKSPSVKKVYQIVNKCTGSLGGNGSGGAIYGELTVGSMQKVVDMMMAKQNLNKDSLFIDIGSGLGKPNIHVAQFPGVTASYGIEHEHVRHQLSLHNLRHILKVAKAQQEDGDTEADERVSHKIYFKHGDVYDARTLDPFTHIYMFDIGFPPKLFEHLSKAYNDSRSPWLTCYHGPKLIIDKYKFNVTLLAQIPTSMHGSSEGHMGYFYARAARPARPLPSPACDPLFAEGIKMMKDKTLDEVHEWVEDQLSTTFNSPRPQRRRSAASRLFAAEV